VAGPKVNLPERLHNSFEAARNPFAAAMNQFGDNPDIPGRRKDPNPATAQRFRLVNISFAELPFIVILPG
jgi:hypothetical protein